MNREEGWPSGIALNIEYLGSISCPSVGGSGERVACMCEEVGESIGWCMVQGRGNVGGLHSIRGHTDYGFGPDPGLGLQMLPPPLPNQGWRHCVLCALGWSRSQNHYVG